MKALLQYGLIRKEKTGNGYYKHYPANGYFALWYGVLLTAGPNADGAFDEAVFDKFNDYLNKNILPGFHRELCEYWLASNINTNSRLHIDTINTSYWNMAKNGFTFDFCYKDSKPTYFDTVPDSSTLIAELWNEIERATAKVYSSGKIVY